MDCIVQLFFPGMIILLNRTLQFDDLIAELTLRYAQTSQATGFSGNECSYSRSNFSYAVQRRREQIDIGRAIDGVVQVVWHRDCARSAPLNFRV